MKLRKSIAVASLSAVAFGGSALGVALVSGAASASDTTTTVASTPTTSMDPAGGANVQVGDQSAIDAAGVNGSDPTEVAGVTSDQSATEVSGAENSDALGATSDGAGGFADPAGNVDNQATGQQ
ncbi:MAG: hypothetical protein KGL79_07020 [Acidobacteriota bacterium]|nr:hypothetical protein [Acidobacteriota bacterium]